MLMLYVKDVNNRRSSDFSLKNADWYNMTIKRKNTNLLCLRLELKKNLLMSKLYSCFEGKYGNKKFDYNGIFGAVNNKK